MLKTLQYMSKFGGLWKRQNNPACVKKCHVFKMLKLDRRQKRAKLHFSKHKNKNVLLSLEIHHRVYNKKMFYVRKEKE